MKPAHAGLDPLGRSLVALAAACMLLAACESKSPESAPLVLPASAADSEERLEVIANGENVGYLTAQYHGNEVDIDYRVDNNGRGPKISEHLVLTPEGIPVEWTISGSSSFGAGVNETFSWRDGTASWSSQADAGSRSSEQPPLYIGGDSSPWAIGMYARALLNTPGGELEVLPAGRMTLQEVGRIALGPGQTPVIVYSLSGISLEPQLVALDESGKLFARIDGRSAIIREGHAASIAELAELEREFELERLHTLQEQLAHRFSAAIRINNVRIFHPNQDSLSGLSSVLVRNGLIAAVEAPVDGAQTGGEILVDGEGGSLVAGLTDMHSHTSWTNGLFYLAAGVTSTRDMGNDNALLQDILAAIEEGEVAGPRITPDGLIEARSPYSARIGVVADTLDEALEAVRWYADNGYFEIKTYNSMNPEWVEPIVAEARALGLGVTGHVPAFMHPDEVISAGYDAIAHANQLMLGWLLEPGEDTRTPLRLTALKRAANLNLDDPRVRHTIDLMTEHGTALDTTAVIIERLMISRAGEIQPGDFPYLSHMPIGYQRYRKRTFVPLDEPGDDEAYRQGFQKVIETVGLLHDAGVQLLPGTDDGTGFTVLRELELYVQAGISPADTLTLATLGAAQYLGQSEARGSIEPGKQADFILVAGNPLHNISEIRQIRLVSRGGVIYFPAEIYRAIGIEPFAAPPAMVAPGETQ